jgi:hypothetical protein
MLAAFPRWIAKEIRWRRKYFAFKSPLSAIHFEPTLSIKELASLHQGPKVSKARALKMKLADFKDLYLLCFLTHAISAAAPEHIDVWFKYDDARVSTQVTSHIRR